MFMLPLFALLCQITEPIPFLPPFFPPEIFSFCRTSTAITLSGTQKVLPTSVGKSIWFGHLWLPPPQWPWQTYYSPSFPWHFLCSFLSCPLLLLGSASGLGFWSPTNFTNRSSFSGLLPQQTSLFLLFSESSLGWLCFLLWLSLSFCRRILVFFSAAVLFTSLDTECPSYNVVLWTDGSVPFLFQKGSSGVLANCSLCRTVAILLFLAGPLCSSFSAGACTILQALCWSRQHQPVCHFSSSTWLSLCLCHPILFSIFSCTSISLADLAGTAFPLLFYQATMGSRTLVSPREWCGWWAARQGALLVPFVVPCSLSSLISCIHSSLFLDRKCTVSSKFFDTLIPLISTSKFMFFLRQALR